MAIGVFLEEITDNFLKKIGGQRYKFLLFFFLHSFIIIQNYVV